MESINRKRSAVWNHFSDNGPKKGKCSYCAGVLSVSSGNVGNLKRHLRSKHPTIKLVKEGQPATGLAGPELSIPPIPPRRPRQIDEQLIKMINRGHFPCSIVEDTEFQIFVALLNPQYTLPTRETLSEENMSRVCQAQMKKLLDLLSEEGVLVNGKVTYNNTNKQNFWKQVALKLNSVEGGVHKNTWKWCKMWADWKNKTKKKANIVLRRKSYNFEHPSPTLTNLELKLLRLINYPMDDKADLLQLQMVNKNDTTDNDTEPIPVEYVVEDYELHSDKDKMSSDEDDTVADFFTETKEDLLNKDNTLFDVESEGSTDTERKNRKGRKTKKKKISIEEYKIKATVALQKEKALQKREEMRLRALELKLKGEELRLKEIEMNKVNYLTNIEEEKLKCFREISSSFKEFLETTRTGNIRFHNVI